MKLVHSREEAIKLLTGDVLYQNSKRFLEETKEPEQLTFQWEYIAQGLFRKKVRKLPENYFEHRRKCFDWIAHYLHVKRIDEAVALLNKCSAHYAVLEEVDCFPDARIGLTLLDYKYCKITEEQQ